VRESLNYKTGEDPKLTEEKGGLPEGLLTEITHLKNTNRSPPEPRNKE